ncbi:MAG: CBS domain-containing protein [Thermoplasmata archaeon]|nr:CBS domain-containing protein [Thermoplasmata archaeon]
MTLQAAPGPTHPAIPEVGFVSTPPTAARNPGGGTRGRSSAEIYGTIVRDIMTMKVVTVDAGATLEVAAALLAGKGISGMPVLTADGQVDGILSEKDILAKLREKAGLLVPGGLFQLILETNEGRQRDLLIRCRSVLTATHVREAMTSPAHVISPSTTIVDAAREMTRRRINRLPVVDHGKLVGIVSRGDVLAAYVEPI